MKIPMLDGPLEGHVINFPDLPQGSVPGHFTWSPVEAEGSRYAVYTPYRVAHRDTKAIKWVFALDRASVERYVEQVNARHESMWRFHCRTSDGELCFCHPPTGRQVVIPADKFWRKQ